MNPKQIAEKYVHGLHDALTDNQEKKDMIKDIEEYAEQEAIDFSNWCMEEQSRGFKVGYTAYYMANKDTYKAWKDKYSANERKEEKIKINPTTKKYYEILVRYWQQSKGERIITIMDNHGRLASNKKRLIHIFAESENIDFIISNLFFEKKILIARPHHGYWGITCVKEPTIEMAEELRVEANKFKANSKKNVDKVKKIEEESNLFK